MSLGLYYGIWLAGSSLLLAKLFSFVVIMCVCTEFQCKDQMGDCIRFGHHNLQKTNNMHLFCYCAYHTRQIQRWERGYHFNFSVRCSNVVKFNSQKYFITGDAIDCTLTLTDCIQWQRALL